MNKDGLSEGVTRVKVSKELYISLEYDGYCAGYSNAKKTFGREGKTILKNLVNTMVRKDIERYL
ncbi:MAG: hypothetical protein M1477_04935 [Candidatus Thermoplasmatota archaeon]|nr:hypothetical protein [Candidatus Thermoplasmatota archaeon]